MGDHSTISSNFAMDQHMMFTLLGTYEICEGISTFRTYYYSKQLNFMDVRGLTDMKKQELLHLQVAIASYELLIRISKIHKMDFQVALL